MLTDLQPLQAVTHFVEVLSSDEILFVSVILNGSTVDFLVVDRESGTARAERCFGVLILGFCGAVVIAVASQQEGSRFDWAFLFCAWEGFPWVIWFPPADQKHVH